MNWKEVAKYRVTNADKLFGCVDRIKPEELTRHADPLYESPKRKKVVHKEPLVILCERWFRMQYSELGLLLFRISGYRDDKKKVRNLNEENGGIPAFFLSVPSGGFHGLYLVLPDTFNLGGSRCSKLEMIAKKNGYAHCVCRNLEGFILNIRSYLHDVKNEY